MSKTCDSAGDEPGVWKTSTIKSCRWAQNRLAVKCVIDGELSRLLQCKPNKKDKQLSQWEKTRRFMRKQARLRSTEREVDDEMEQQEAVQARAELENETIASN